jgi:hypothetical protein
VDGQRISMSRILSKSAFHLPAAIAAGKVAEPSRGPDRLTFARVVADRPPDNHIQRRRDAAACGVALDRTRERLYGVRQTISTLHPARTHDPHRHPDQPNRRPRGPMKHRAGTSRRRKD